MTFPDERDGELEELLRTTLHGEAEGISPAGDGLARIQQRVGARRARRAWLRPVVAAGAIAVVGGAGALGYALTRPSPHSDSVTSVNPSPTGFATASSAPTRSTNPKPPGSGFPSAAFYPFASAGAEQAWEASGGATSQPWMLNPMSAAQRFVADFVQQPSVDTVVKVQPAGSADTTVVLGRTLTDGSGQHPVAVTAVHLVRFGKAWVVTGAADPSGYLRVSAPAAGSTISSPVTVSGPSYGVDESVAVDVRSLAGRDATGAVAHVTFGNGSAPWTTTVDFNVPQDPRGAVVAVATSNADGGPGRIVVNAVTFATTTLVDYPKYFFGVKNGRVAKLASRTGATISYLTPAQPVAGATDPQLVGDRVYYLAGAGTCTNTLRSVPASGGASDTVTTSRSGYAVTSYAVSSDSREVALFETACKPSSSSPQGVLVSTIRGTATSHTIAFPSFPPMVVGDPSWEPDGQHLDAVVRTGNLAGVVRWNAFSAKDLNDGQPVCGNLSGQGLPTALQLDGTGAAWVATQSGGGTSVLRCVGNAHTTMFTVAGNAGPQDLAVTGNGRAVLVTDGSGKVWRWSSGTTSAAPLTPTVPQTDVTW